MGDRRVPRNYARGFHLHIIQANKAARDWRSWAHATVVERRDAEGVLVIEYDGGCHGRLWRHSLAGVPLVEGDRVRVTARWGVLAFRSGPSRERWVSVKVLDPTPPQTGRAVPRPDEDTPRRWRVHVDLETGEGVAVGDKEERQ